MLTQKQYKLLAFFLAHRKKTGICPSYEEMRTFLGLQSKSSIHQIVNQLIERGYMRRLANRARALEVIKYPHGPSWMRGDNVEPLDEAHHLLEKQSFVSIPLYGAIAAGRPVEAFQNDDVVAVPLGRGGGDGLNLLNRFALRVMGDSMKEAGILDGDVAILEVCGGHVPDGTIVAAIVDEAEVTLKRVYWEENQVVLMPANRDFVPLTFEVHRIQVQGILVSIFRTYTA